LVEFALILPIFMMLILGMLSGGRAYNNKIDITNAVREGARYGAVLPRTQTNWATVVRDRVLQRSEGLLTTNDVCVALVDTTSGTVVSTGAGGPWSAAPSGFPANCYDDSGGDDSLRVHVAARRGEKIEAMIFTSSITLRSKATARHE
jgi:Flp pilus assembly protein TadG